MRLKEGWVQGGGEPLRLMLEFRKVSFEQDLALRISSSPTLGFSKKRSPMLGSDWTVEEKSGWRRGGAGMCAEGAPAQALHVRGLRCDSTMPQSQTAAARVLGTT